MAAATELLKPYMTGESSETIGRVCLGTVRGDMHDIGKNLVKIMMEGSGLEVELEGRRSVLRNGVEDAVSRVRGKVALDADVAEGAAGE